MTRGNIQSWRDVSDALLHMSNVLTQTSNPLGTYEYESLGNSILRVKIQFDLIPTPTPEQIYRSSNYVPTDDDVPF